jgi:hypothetical protein
MRWQEILLLTETDVDEVARRELAALFGMMKVKGVKTLPLDKIVSQITYNNMSIDPEDTETVKKITDIITSLDNLVDKVEDDVIHLKYPNKPEYAPSKTKGENDKTEVKKSAMSQAQKNLKTKNKKGGLKI